MKGFELQIMICPLCKRGFREQGPSRMEEDVIICHYCGKKIPIIDGIYHFLEKRPSLSGIDYNSPGWQLKEREREREYEQNFGLDDIWLNSLPFPSIEIETTFQKKRSALGKNFFEILSQLNLRGEERILDMAAGCCWTSNEFVKLGCQVVSTDIRTIKYHGLRSADAYHLRESSNLVRLCWTFGEIPFVNDCFDIVFCQNAFQYVTDLTLMLSEIRRVLRRNGRFVLAWTGVRTRLKSEKWGPGHRLCEYVKGAQGQGFSCSIHPPVSLFSEYGEEAIRSHFGQYYAKLYSNIRTISPAFQRTLAKFYPLLGRLLGVPFNMVAYRG